jgi:hypothetical protein
MGLRSLSKPRFARIDGTSPLHQTDSLKARIYSNENAAASTGFGAEATRETSVRHLAGIVKRPQV